MLNEKGWIREYYFIQKIEILAQGVNSQLTHIHDKPTQTE